MKNFLIAKIRFVFFFFERIDFERIFGVCWIEMGIVEYVKERVKSVE